MDMKFKKSEQLQPCDAGDVCLLGVPGVVAQKVSNLNHGAVMLAVLVLSGGDGSNAGVSTLLMVAVGEFRGDVDLDWNRFASPHRVVL